MSIFIVNNVISLMISLFLDNFAPLGI